ncbi:hypothetical protein B0A52_01105 [Exophiala mesophila]|uniref:NADPH-dependent FMN reductase-like domain-containing protein n=1 Tax=Exophiala mesophila TaxID=212818 RepID=A0A438NGH1_EXOME|nr:hypothetical protein B0A52_01105 [Exophiala mesophila]
MGDILSGTTTAANTSPVKIGIIIGSQRTPRAGDQIATWVLSVLEEYQANTPPEGSTSKPYSLHLIDLNDHPLPLFNEPGIPSRITSSSEYTHAHTREWSQFISSFAGFVFVTPQYNWGYPASLKNAIDYLFNEWKGKPAMVVSYGGHGGGKAAQGLKVVLQGLRMRLVDEHVELVIGGMDEMKKAARGQPLGLDGEHGRKIWVPERAEIGLRWEKFLELLNQ